jgi:tetraprenyl-beta-curcumene synthase
MDYMMKNKLMQKNQRLPWRLIWHYIFRILPRVEKELRGWRKFLKGCPSTSLQVQALSSIRDKRFHCQGGAVFALLNPAAENKILPLIISLQTISDYLDNLCDRLDWEELAPLTTKEKDRHMEKGFRQLHLSMLAGLQPQNILPQNFYRYYPFHEDGGYLQALANCCQKHTASLPSYQEVQEKVLFLTGLYIDLQALKHLSLKNRQGYLEEWFEPYKNKYPALRWNEFAAAAGSTLGTFGLLTLAASPQISLPEVEALYQCYFPWICGLHILLDYFIDQEEDRREKDLNFVFYYDNQEQCLQRMVFFIENALQRTETLADAYFHRTVVKGLLALYLSDPKIKEQKMQKLAHRLLAATGEQDTFHLYRLCLLLRKSRLL